MVLNIVTIHEAVIETARARPREAGLSNVRFEAVDATSYEGRTYDLIAFFDALHDMADPSGAARHAREALKADGHCLLVEPFAGDTVAENLNPVGRVYYAASSMVCVPASLARGGPALGAQAGEERLRRVMVDEGGIHASPPGHRDARQSGARGPAVRRGRLR
jgi:SAM-dependent methyltransferase